MRSLKSWRALLVREYLEHRMPFLYFPLGILALFALSGASSLAFNRVQLLRNVEFGNSLKVFEIGYIGLLGVWLAYLGVALFFYFGDAFSADRRNNAMLFWKSMPVSDLKMLASKFLAGVLLFPLMLFVIGIVSGLLLYGALNLATLTFHGLIPPDPVAALASFVNITGFGIVYLALAMLWFAPFMAWVGGLSTVFGRWSLPLAFVVPGVLILIENMALIGQEPRGGYIWAYLSKRWQFGLSGPEIGVLFISPAHFDMQTYFFLLFRETDWVAMAIGLAFTVIVMALASEYRRRRIA